MVVVVLRPKSARQSRRGVLLGRRTAGFCPDIVLRTTVAPPCLSADTQQRPCYDPAPHAPPGPPAPLLDGHAAREWRSCSSSARTGARQGGAADASTREEVRLMIGTQLEVVQTRICRT